jgi:pullulanase
MPSTDGAGGPGVAAPAAAKKPGPGITLAGIPGATEAQEAVREPLASHGLPAGVLYDESGCRFSVEAEAERVWVRLEHPESREVRTVELERTREADAGHGLGLWQCEAQGDLRGWSYVYDVERAGSRLGGIIDPWATLVAHGKGFIENESSEVAERPDMEPSEAIIYELHVRDFTLDPNSGVHSDERGTYLGLARRGSTIPGTQIATGLDHILDLGVTVVQLMPVHSFSLPYNPMYEWGYMPNDFNAPHAGYASRVGIESPISEFKRLVSTLHKLGLRVTLDVVYNHTAEYWPFKLRNMMALAPGHYYRFKPDGTAWNGSGCGNEFASETALGRRFIRESVKYWVRRFGIDGYRFDLMGLMDARTTELLTADLKAMDDSILVYGEPWPGGETPIEVNNKGKQRSKGWGVFNDELRDAVRGEVFELDDLGFINGEGDANKLRSGIRGGLDTFADQPTETINYIEAHDNHTLIDRLKITAERVKLAGSTPADLARMSRLGALIVLTAQGIPFLHSAQEFGRTKFGEDNSYNLGDDVNNVRWLDKSTNNRLYRHYREAVHLRRSHPMFRLGTRELVDKGLRFLDTDLGYELPAGTVGFTLVDPLERDSWKAAVCLFNGNDDDVTMPIPQGPWLCEMQDGELDRTSASRRSTITEREIVVARFSGTILFKPRSNG